MAATVLTDAARSLHALRLESAVRAGLQLVALWVLRPPRCEAKRPLFRLRWGALTRDWPLATGATAAAGDAEAGGDAA